MDIMLSERLENLLGAVVERYVASAEPVSSKLLAKRGFFGLKSASIRNALGELEEQGYLTHPYTSGGRVPTDAGYRYYVDNLLDINCQAPPTPRKQQIRQTIRQSGNDPWLINHNVAQLLSAMTGNLVITAIDEEDDFFKVGLASLFEQPDFQEMNRMFRLTSFFEGFDEMFGQLERAFFSQAAEADDDVKIAIGQENPVKDIRDETVMFAKYGLPDGYSGSLTLVGPTRMKYAENIGLIRYTTDELNKLAKRS